MDYHKIVAVTGLSGLYELLSSKADGGIVRSLDDKTTKFVSTRVHNFSHLESIEVYTVKDNVNLVEIFAAMKASKEKLPDAKADDKALKAYFKKVYADMDFERVYVSDLKKMVKWFQVLTTNKIEIKLSDTKEEDVPVPETITPKAKPAAAKKTTVKDGPATKKINVPRKMA
ncbi:MAG: DUF5606 domain-containing protein [Ferruginibacter sp.]